MNLEYKELSDKAYQLHSQNMLDEAEKIYMQLLNINSEDYNILYLCGMLYISKQKYELAIKYLTKALIIKNSAFIASNLAKAYYLSGDVEKSITLYKRAIDIKPSDDIYYSLAISYKKNNDLKNAINYYKRAIEVNPKHYNALYNLSLSCRASGDIDSAIEYSLKCYELNNSDVDIISMVSELYQIKQDYTKSLEFIKKAIAINPDNYVFYYNAAVISSKMGFESESINLYKKSILLNEKHIESYVNLSCIIKKTDKEEALKYLQKAYSIDKNSEFVCLSLAQLYRELYNNIESINVLNSFILKNRSSAEAYSLLAMNCMDLGDYTNALNFYNKAIDIQPANINYKHGKAVAYKYLNKIDKCYEILEDIVKNNPDANQSCITLGMLYLTDKKFEKGMNLYRYRCKDSTFSDIFKNKVWSKDTEIFDKRLLLYSDCGLGDTLMYARYLNIVKNIAKSVTLQTDKELVNILSSNFKDINIISKSQIPDKYDVVMSIMDLQYALNSDFYSIPYSEGYINIEQELIDKYSKLSIINGKKNKIGIFYKGNKRIFKNRFIDYNIIASLFELKNCNFYSFQIDDLIEESENVYNLSHYICDYKDTAALLKNMDILITIDSSIVHMAGSLGVKTFLLLPNTPEWRWFRDTEKTPWYKSVKIYKQSEPNNWSDVILKVKNSLESL